MKILLLHFPYILTSYGVIPFYHSWNMVGYLIGELRLVFIEVLKSLHAGWQMVRAIGQTNFCYYSVCLTKGRNCS